MADTGCVFCPKEVLVISERFCEHHDTDPSAITESSQLELVNNGSLFQMQYYKGSLKIYPFYFDRDYAIDGGFITPVPTFGVAEWQVFWVCNHCLKILESQKKNLGPNVDIIACISIYMARKYFLFSDYVKNRAKLPLR